MTLLTNPRQYRWFILIAGVVLATAQADTIYKSVDKHGNVIYSEHPPADGDNVKVIKPLPEPGEEEVEAARQRQQKLQQKIDQSASSTPKAGSEDWETTREMHRRRAFWGRDWPVHEPPNK